MNKKERIVSIDTNVFIHAMLKMKPKMNEKEMHVKQNSMKILTRIQYEEEDIQITTLQIAEIMNLLERWEGHEIARDIFQFLLQAPNVKIYEVTQEELKEAFELAERYKENKIGMNDLVTYVAMQKACIIEVYSFDNHFDQFEDVTRLIE